MRRALRHSLTARLLKWGAKAKRKDMPGHMKDVLSDHMAAMFEVHNESEV